MFVRLLFLIVVSAGLVACASTGAEAPDPTGVSAPTSGAGSASAEGSAIPALEESAGEELADVDPSAMPRQNRMVAGGKDPNELICRRERQTGSKFTVKTCMTRAEMEERARSDQEIMETYQRKRASAGEPGSSGCC